MSRWLHRCVVVAVLSGFAGTARAEPVNDVSVWSSLLFGPVPNEMLFPAVDVAVAHTWWNRFRAGVVIGGGSGGNARWFEQTYADLGAVIHPSQSLDLVVGWRFGAAHYALFNRTFNATAIESYAELRFRARANVDVIFAPMVVAYYWSGVFSIRLGPEIGAAVRF